MLKAIKELEQPTSDHEDWKSFTNTFVPYLDSLVDECLFTKNSLRESFDAWKQIDIVPEGCCAGGQK